MFALPHFTRVKAYFKSGLFHLLNNLMCYSPVLFLPAIMKQIAWKETRIFSPSVYICNILNKNFNLCGKIRQNHGEICQLFLPNGTEMTAFWLLEKISAYRLAKRERFKIKNNKDDMSRHQITNVAMQILLVTKIGPQCVLGEFISSGWNAVLKYQYLGVEILQVKR